MAALECLRDISLEYLIVAIPNDSMMHTRWYRSISGEEFARTYSWGNDPARARDYDAASPCDHLDVPQTNGFQCCFDTSFLSFERETGGTILSRVQDNLTKYVYYIRSKYLFGCEGARSQVLRQLNTPLIKNPGQGLATNILVKVDLSQVLDTRKGNLHWVMQPDGEHPAFGWATISRMIKPWNEWMFIMLPRPGSGFDFQPTHKEYLEALKHILDILKWYINEMIAEYYSEGNIFCLGDAVHRHPPFNGLGSNTCIQDAYNLAWKIAYFMKNRAGPEIFESYSAERQPVGEGLITRANQGLRDHILLSAATPEGSARIARLQDAVCGTSQEFHAVGVEMNQRYESRAVYAADEKARPPLPNNSILEHKSHLPREPTPSGLASYGVFSLFIGAAARTLGIEIRVYSISWAQNYKDVYFNWARRREVSEDGYVLVRLDRFVGWRSQSMISQPKEKLLLVLRAMLSRPL
ncbi:FAD binding domain-containing protein [Leptodontidium sp. MPI-SDFR-AT-0119]|nr:FAD binding domain-containing protein [Leptodontidium sp. MPI-SDFR-AT-0119]